jgi:hypothetical protein
VTRLLLSPFVLRDGPCMQGYSEDLSSTGQHGRLLILLDSNTLPSTGSQYSRLDGITAAAAGNDVKAG